MVYINCMYIRMYVCTGEALATACSRCTGTCCVRTAAAGEALVTACSWCSGTCCGRTAAAGEALATACSWCSGTCCGRTAAAGEALATACSWCSGACWSLTRALLVNVRRYGTTMEHVWPAPQLTTAGKCCVDAFSIRFVYTLTSPLLPQV